VSLGVFSVRHGVKYTQMEYGRSCNRCFFAFLNTLFLLGGIQIVKPFLFYQQ